MIDSVRAQTMPDWELIIVDDGSTEDIKGLIEAYNDTRIVYVRFPENKGIPHGLNYALSLASGDYVQPLSADEFIWERKLEVQVAWMDEHPGIGCTWGLPQTGELGERPSYEQYQLRAHNRSREAWIRTLLRLEMIPIGGASMLMRRECYKEIGGFDPQFFFCSDLEWFVRFFQRYQGWILPYRLADADQPDTRLTAPRPDSGVRFQEDLLKVHAKHKILLPPPTGRVTVGIPVRNMANFVKASIDSVLAQTVPCDLIVIDDASTDDTAKVLAEILPPEAKFLQMAENVGVAAANNHMLAMCETEFYLPFSADDVLEPTFVERCLKEFEQDPFLEMVASQTDFIDAEGKTLTEHFFLQIPKAANKPREQWLHVLYYGNQYFGAGMYRTYALREIGGWDSTVGVICDYEVYLKLLQRENIKIIEENLTHTRAHDGQQSMLKEKERQLELRKHYHMAKTRYYPPRRKIIIATPFYEMRGFSPYISSLAATVQQLTRLGFEHEFWELSGDSYVDRAKNTIFNKFLEDPANTDLFMIDSDMAWDSQSFVDMLHVPAEIVMGSYPQKNQWGAWTAIPKMKEQDGLMFPDGVVLSNSAPLIRAQYLAGGYIRIARSALEKYKEKYADLTYMDQGADPSHPNRVYTEFFTCERAQLNGEGPMLRWGEDRVFGNRMQQIGVEAWIYPRANLGHFGIKGWSGNYHNYLKDPQKGAVQ